MGNRAHICAVLPAHALVTGLTAALLQPATAAFHKMQIQQVIVGVAGDTTAQAIQLRQRDDQNCFVNTLEIWAHDAQGLNPILLIQLSNNLPGCQLGDTVLIASANFANYTDLPLNADFTMTNLIPDSYLAAGSITYEFEADILWRLSWGGAAYTGSNAGENDNDDDGNFGPPYPFQLPSGVQAVQFQGPAAAESTTNLDDYALTVAESVWTNNAGASVTVVNPCPGNVNGDCVVGIVDFLDLLAAWGSNPGHPADLDLDGTVGIVDFLALLAAWGPCPQPCPPSTVLTLQEELDDACLTDDDWDEYVDVMTDETSSQAKKDRYDCWMKHYINDCNKCQCPRFGHSGCPNPDPFL